MFANRLPCYAAVVLVALISVLLQAAPAVAAPPLIVQPSKDVSGRPALKALGDTLQYAGHCSRFLPRGVMDKFLIVARAQPADEPYLMGRIGAGSRAPKDQKWCAAHQPR